MRIAHIGTRGLGSNYGGIERCVDAICPILAAMGHEVDVFGRSDIRFENRDGLRHVPIPGFRSKHFENLTRSAIATLLAVKRYDIVHFHAIGPGALSLFTALFGQRSVVTIHGLDHRRAKWGRLARILLRAGERTLITCADQITVVSSTLADHYQKEYGIRTIHTPNGLPSVRSLKPGAFLRTLGLKGGDYILFASRLTPEKGCHDLIEAFKRIRTTRKLVIAGDGTAPDYVRSLHRGGQQDNIVFVGHRSGNELAELFSNAYLFVLPSYLEGMSQALLESISYRIPALVSDIEENLEIIGGYGFWVPNGNITMLGLKLEHLLNSPGLVAEMADRLQGVQMDDWDEVAKKYNEIYRNVARSAPAAVAVPDRL